MVPGPFREDIPSVRQDQRDAVKEQMVEERIDGRGLFSRSRDYTSNHEPQLRWSEPSFIGSAPRHVG